MSSVRSETAVRPVSVIVPPPQSLRSILRAMTVLGSFGSATVVIFDCSCAQVIVWASDGQVDLVLARVEVGDRVVAAVLAEHEGVGVGPAGQRVVALAADQHVFAGAAGQRVVALATEQDIVAFAAVQRVGALTAEQPVVALLAVGACRRPRTRISGCCRGRRRSRCRPSRRSATRSRRIRKVEHVLGEVGLGDALEGDGAAAPGREVDDRGRLVHARRQWIVLDLRHCRLQVLPGDLLPEARQV